MLFLVCLFVFDGNQIYDDDPLPKQICVNCDLECTESHSKLMRIRSQEEYWTRSLSENDPFKRILAFREQQKDELQKKIQLQRSIARISANNVSGSLKGGK